MSVKSCSNANLRDTKLDDGTVIDLPIDATVNELSADISVGAGITPSTRWLPVMLVMT